jgi:hypothetical protein
MQSGNVAIRIALVKQYPYQRQHLHQRTPESSRQEHQARGIDGKSPKEMLDLTLHERIVVIALFWLVSQRDVQQEL